MGDSKLHLKSSNADVTGAFIADGDESTEKSIRSRVNFDQNNLFFTHVGALLSKRAANFRRDKKAWCCTTILPGIFVLAGLLIFKFTGNDRVLEPLELSLDDYNPDVKSTPRNPITVNNVNDVFQCQPGQCAYSAGNFPFAYPEYENNYVLCGIQALVNSPLNLTALNQSLFDSQTANVDLSGFQSCSVTDSLPFVDQINAAGVETIVVDVNTVENVSHRSHNLDGIVPYPLSYLKCNARRRHHKYFLTTSKRTRPPSMPLFSTPMTPPAF